MSEPTMEAGDAPATGATHAATRPRPARNLMPVVWMAALFLASVALAVAIAPTYEAQNLQAFKDPQSVTNPLIYLVVVLVFTGVILLIARWKKQKLIQLLILAAVFLTIIYVFWPLLRLVVDDNTAFIVGLILSLALVALLYFFPEWYVIDAVGIGVSAGAAAIFGISFGLLPALILLTVFAVYDAIAVYRTKHMLDLADSVLELRLPIMFVVPKTRGYSFLEEKTKVKESTGEEREAMFMGLGDVVIPTVLVISALHFLAAFPAHVPSVLGLAPAVAVAGATLVGSLLGYCALMYFVLKGNAQAGLPLLNGGAILGFFVSMLPLYGIGPVWPF
ncbi:MAG: presenilin family intramembrane aspartyl protease PSH [Thermoplasmatota archaeon]